MIPDWKSEETDGIASKVRTMVAPELCPAIVIFEELPPKLGTTLVRNCRAVILSLIARLVSPLGGMSPNYETINGEIFLMGQLNLQHPSDTESPLQ